MSLLSSQTSRGERRRDYFDNGTQTPTNRVPETADKPGNPATHPLVRPPYAFIRGPASRTRINPCRRFAFRHAGRSRGDHEFEEQHGEAATRQASVNVARRVRSSRSGRPRGRDTLPVAGKVRITGEYSAISPPHFPPSILIGQIATAPVRSQRPCLARPPWHASSVFVVTFESDSTSV